MGFNCGIVGLPNVGKSTLFNALTATAAAEAANYPFCTIEPNIGRVAVPDERLEVCARLGKSAKIVPTQLEFVDIAGLVRGASRGEGLGNQFLGHIREVDAIAHVLRCFEDGNVTHVEGSIDPIRDAETVETELLLADLESLERRLVATQKKVRGDDREAKQLLAVMEPVLSRSPSLAEMIAAWRAAQARFPQVTSLADPMFAAPIGPGNAFVRKYGCSAPAPLNDVGLTQSTCRFEPFGPAPTRVLPKRPSGGGCCAYVE